MTVIVHNAWRIDFDLSLSSFEPRVCTCYSEFGRHGTHLGPSKKPSLFVDVFNRSSALLGSSTRPVSRRGTVRADTSRNGWVLPLNQHMLGKLSDELNRSSPRVASHPCEVQYCARRLPDARGVSPVCGILPLSCTHDMISSSSRGCGLVVTS